MKKRIISILTALALCLSLCPAWAFAADPDAGLCAHHRTHTGCGYAPPAGGRDDYELGADAENPLDCPPAPGAPCAYVCKLCPIEDRIAALPGTVTEDNRADVRARLDEILALYRDLTEDEQEQLDLSGVTELQAALDAANAPAPAEGRAEQQLGDEAGVTTGSSTLYYATVEEAFEKANTQDNATIKLLSDAEASKTLMVDKLITLDCGGHTLTSSQEYTISLLNPSSGLTLRNGKVENTCPSGDAIDFQGQKLIVEDTAVLEAIGPDSVGINKGSQRDSEFRIAGKVKGRMTGINARHGALNLDVCSSAVIAGGLSGIFIGGDQSVITLNGGAIIGGSKNAIEIDNGNHTITVSGGMTATLNDTELASPIISSTNAGTLVICANHQPGEWGADGTRTCPKCSFKQQAVAKIEKDGGTAYIASVPDFLLAFNDNNSGAAVTLLDDVVWDGDAIQPPDNTSFTLRLNGKVMMNTAYQKEVFLLSGASSSLTVEGDGSVISGSTFAITVGDGAAVNIHGGTFTGGVFADLFGTLKLYGGVFEAAPDNESISVIVPIRELLGTAGGKTYAYYDGNDVPITGKLNEYQLYGTVKVKECRHTVTGYQITKETHRLICAACEKEMRPPENHIRDGNVCTVCGHAAVVAEVLTGGTTAQYGTLAEAWAAATAPGVTGAVITLVHDVTGGGDSLFGLTEGHSVTLKGQGHTISRHCIQAEGGELRVENCTISDMDTRSCVEIYSGTAEIKDTVINGETLIHGGESALTHCKTEEIYLSGTATTVRLTDCQVSTRINGITVYKRGTAELTRCEVTGGQSGVWVEDGNLTIHSGSFTSTDEYGCGLRVYGNSSVTLQGGTFSGSTASIATSDDLTLGGLLGHTATARYAYYRDETGAPISVGSEDRKLTGTVTVKECAASHEYTHTPGTAVHSLTCAACGANGKEPCCYDNGTCACGSTLAVTLPGELVYTGTEQEPPVSVTLDGATLDASQYSVTYYDNLDAGTALAVVAGTGDVLPFRESRTFSILPATLTVSGISAESRPYDGANEVAITAVTLDGITAADQEEGGCVSVVLEALTGRTDGADAGTYDAVTLPWLELTGPRYRNYTLVQPTGPFPVTVTIAKAERSPKAGALAVTNKRAHTYSYGLDTLLPDLPDQMRFGPGAVVYELDAVNLGGYCTRGAAIAGQTLTLPIEAVESSAEGSIGTVTVIIKTGNFADMTAVINVRSTNQIIPEGAPTLSADTLTYGKPLRAIVLSGGMMDGNTPVPGTFAWSSPDSRPAVQEAYEAAWTFTPDDTGTYLTISGTAIIRVLPAPLAGADIELEPSAFRYDGAAHRPGVSSVTLDGMTLAAGVDYTAQIPEGTEAGTYSVTLTGMGNYTGTATAVFTVNPVEQKPLDQTDDDGHALRLEVESGLSSVPAALAGDTRYNTPKKIETALRTKVAEVISNVGEQIAVFDVALQYKDENGTWHNVDPNNFPAKGVTAILPYPAGTGATGYTFTVQHLISSGSNAGQMETLTYELTADGLQCKFSSLSPVAIGYQAAAKPVDPNPGGSSGGGGVSTYAVTVEKPEHGEVTSNRTNASSGSTVTLTVTPDSGYVLDTLTVTDSRGNAIKLAAQSGGKYTFTMPGRAVTVKAAFAPLPDDTACDGGANCPSHGFTDLGSVGTWYHEAVDFVLRNGLMNGYTSTLFGPDENLSRAQLAQILYNREGKPSVTDSGVFTDVDNGAWYAPAITWAAGSGIVGGYGDGTFGPNDNITREQLAVMLWRYAGNPVATDKELHFADAGKVSRYAAEALRWAVENGVINGIGGGILDPQGLATRAQVAQMLKNLLEK